METLHIESLALANNKGADQPAPMRRLMCTFVVRTQQSQVCTRQGPIIPPLFLIGEISLILIVYCRQFSGEEALFYEAEAYLVFVL